MHSIATVAHHETSPWPLVTGGGVLATALLLLAAALWGGSTATVVLGGIAIVLLAVGIAGWAREFFTAGAEEGLGPVAVIAFIVSEIIIFGTMFAAFWAARIGHAQTWSSFVPEGLNLGLAALLTLILWASSATILWAERAATGGRRHAAAGWLAATFALGVLFVLLHMNEWAHLAAHGFRIGANPYASTFYGLTGVHTSHVIVGLVSHVVMFWVILRGWMTPQRVTFLRASALYWHFVDIMWLMVAANAYLVGGLA